MQRRDTPWRKLRKYVSHALLLVLIVANVEVSGTQVIDTTIEHAANKTLPTAKPSQPEELELNQTRYLSHGVYLGNYPGFIAPGHSLSGTYFLPAETNLVIHYRAQPYQGAMPPAQLLINGQPILEFTELDNQVLTAKIPQTFTGRLAELTIAFEDYLPASGSIQLDSQRTPINIPLLHIDALVLQPELQSQLVSYD